MTAKLVLYGVPTVPAGRVAACIDIFTAGATEALEEAEAVLSARLVAVTVILVVAETCGAVNRPLVEIVPAVACQTTAVLLVDVSVAENCCCFPGRTLTLLGVRVISTAEALDGVCVLELTPDGSPAHPAHIPAA